MTTLPVHCDFPQAETIPMHHFEDSATFGDFFRHYRHRCLGFNPNSFPYDILQDPRPSRQKLNGEGAESMSTRDVTLERKNVLSLQVGSHIRFTRNKNLIRPAIKKLCDEARENQLPLQVIMFLNQGRLASPRPPYRNESLQTSAYHGEVYFLINNIINLFPQCLPGFKSIAQNYWWLAIEPPTAGKSSAGGFGLQAEGDEPPKCKIAQEDKTIHVAESKSQKDGSKSLMEELAHYGDNNRRYLPKLIIDNKATIDKFIRQMLDNVTTRHPRLYLLSSYNTMLVLKVRPPTAKEPFTKVEVSEEYRRYPTGPLFESDGSFSHDLGTVSMATATLAMSLRPVDDPAWDWEDSYTWPDEDQILDWMAIPEDSNPSSRSRDDDDDPPKEPRRRPITRLASTEESATMGKSTSKRKTSSSSNSKSTGKGGMQATAGVREDGQLQLVTFFPHGSDQDCLYRQFYLDRNSSFKTITQPNHPLMRRRVLRPRPNGMDRDVVAGSLSMLPPHWPSLTFGSRIGRGHLGVVFSGKLSLGSDSDESIDVAIKLVMPGAFHSEKDGPIPIDRDGYTQLSSEDAERLIRHEATVYDRAIALQGTVIPQCFGLWHGRCLNPDGTPSKLDVYMLITELLPERPVEEPSILSAYRNLHAAGFTHGDVTKRHWKNGRIIDLERAVFKPTPRRKNQVKVYRDPGIADEVEVTEQQWTKLARGELERVRCIFAGEDDDDEYYYD